MRSIVFLALYGILAANAWSLPLLNYYGVIIPACAIYVIGALR